MTRNKFLSFSSSEYRKKQSLSAIEEKVNRLKPSDEDDDDEKEKRVFSKLVPSVQMQDERYKVLVRVYCGVYGEILAYSDVVLDAATTAAHLEKGNGIGISYIQTNVYRDMYKHQLAVDEMRLLGFRTISVRHIFSGEPIAVLEFCKLLSWHGFLFCELGHMSLYIVIDRGLQCGKTGSVVSDFIYASIDA